MLFDIAISSIFKGSILLALALLYVQRAKRSTAAAKHNTLVGALLALLIIPLLELLPKLELQVLSPHTVMPNTHGSMFEANGQLVALLLLCVYALGALIGLFRIQHDYRALTRQLKSATPCAMSALPPHIAQLAGEHPRAISFWYLESLNSPITVGERAPKIILPTRFLDQPGYTVSVALQHELAHIRRHDWAVQLASQIMRALFWFNPLVHYCAKYILSQAEIAADDEVVLAGEDAPDYASVLLNYAQKKNSASTKADQSNIRYSGPKALWTAMLGPGLAGRIHSLTRRTPRRYYDGFGLAEKLAFFVLLLLPFTVVTAVPGKDVLQLFSANATVDLKPTPVDDTTVCQLPTLTGLQRPSLPPTAPHIELAKWAPNVEQALPRAHFAIHAPEPRLDSSRIARLTPHVSRVGFMPLVNVMPNYPSKALRRNIEGFVDVVFDIQRDGNVSNARVIRSEPRNVFDRTALKALQQSRFAVHQVNGNAVQVRGVENRYVFRLSEPDAKPLYKESPAPETHSTEVLIAQGVHHDYL